MYELTTIIVMASAMTLSAADAATLDACNSERVKNILLENYFVNVRKKVLDFKDTYWMVPEVRTAIENWRSDVKNIRQEEFDSTNKKRFCAADIANNLPTFIVATVSGNLPLPDLMRLYGACYKVVYRIEETLDRPDDVYVSWQCSK